jgi:hypothetical protein
VWINNDQVSGILSGDGYENVNSSDAQAGDVAVYLDSSGSVVHSATVSAVDPDTGIILVEGLGGLETKTHEDNLMNPDPGLKAKSVGLWRK